MITPGKTQPAHILHDRIDILDLLLAGIGVIETEVAAAAILPGQPEIETDGLGMADVKITVGLGREPGHHPAVVLVRLEIPVDDSLDKVGNRGRIVCAHTRIFLY